jgi:hypothetical protein
LYARIFPSFPSEKMNLGKIGLNLGNHPGLLLCATSGAAFLPTPPPLSLFGMTVWPFFFAISCASVLNLQSSSFSSGALYATRCCKISEGQTCFSCSYIPSNFVYSCSLILYCHCNLVQHYVKSIFAEGISSEGECR